MQFPDTKELTRHKYRTGHRNGENHRCGWCPVSFKTRAEVQRHIEQEHLKDDYHVINSAFGRYVEVVEKVYRETSAPRNVDHFMHQEESRLIDIITSYRHRLKTMKTYFVLVGSSAVVEMLSATMQPSAPVLGAV